MVAVGLWTLKNIRSIRPDQVATVLPASNTEVVGNLNAGQSKKRQLAWIVLIDIDVYIICSLPLSSVLMYQQITQYNTKSVLQSQIELFVRYGVTSIAYIPYCVSCLHSFIWLENVSKRNQGYIISMQISLLLLFSTIPISYKTYENKYDVSCNYFIIRLTI
jgi:hypothetical protein